MNGAYAHLLVNHIPVIGIPVCLAFFVAGWFRKNSETVKIALWGFVVMGVLSFVTLRTGGPAAKTLFDYPGVTIDRAVVHEHAEAGEGACVGSSLLAALALAALYLMHKKGELPKTFAWVLLAGAVAVSAAMGKAAHEGGLIRHPEISTDATA